MGLHLVHRYIVESLTVTRAFCKIFLFHSILFIFEYDGGPMRGKVTSHTLKILRETRFVKPIPIYDTFIILVKRCRWQQHVVTDPRGAWPQDCRVRITGLTHAKLVSLTSPCCSGWLAPMNTLKANNGQHSSDGCADFNAWLESDLVLIINFNSTHK